MPVLPETVSLPAPPLIVSSPPSAVIESFPLVHLGRPQGEIVLVPRSPRESLDARDRALLVQLGAMIAAAINTFVPREIIDSVAGSALLAVVTLAAFAFVVALCSEADAFVAASLNAFSDTAKLVFMVVGPAMDVKLASMESGQFGGAFALRFVPLVLAVAVLSACGMGWWLL